MSTKNLRTSLPSSSSSAAAAASSSSLAKRNASSLSSSEIHRGKAPTLARKRPPLSNITNLKNVRHPDPARNIPARPATHLVPSSAKAAKPNKDSTVGNRNAPLNLKPTNINPPRKATPAPVVVGVRKDETITSHTSSIPPALEVSPARSDSLSVSMDETMSTCDSFKSPDVEYVDNTDDSASVSIERKSFTNLSISEPKETSGRICSRNVVADMETDEDIVDVDYNFNDPQLCATIAGDIYKHLRATELKKRPSTDYMEKVQKDVIPSMRAILIDWLVEVAEEYRLMPDTLYLTVNYVDRYLSGNPMDRQRLQLLGIACMMIASKYEEICAPQVEEFCYITDNTYFRDEVLEMESSVLNYLKFEMTAPTAKCFLRRFARAAQGNNEVPSLQLEFLASYIAELSLVEYNMLFYAPSLVAASSIFLAKYILFPSKRPWTPTLQRYTLYEPADLQDCVKALHQLCWKSHISSLPAIREKYSQHKYKFVAKRYCPSSIPPECFHNLSK